MKKQLICNLCGKENAIWHDYYGWIPGESCQKKHKKYFSPKVTIEITTPEIKDSRVRYKADIVQPYRDGVVSREYLEQYGTKSIKVTKKELKNAKYVWNSEEYYKK